MLTIGRHQFDVPFAQAALSGYSDLPMRRMARKYGAAYTLNEVVLDRLVTQRGKKSKKILRVADDDHPVGGQLLGADPDDFAPAAEAMADAGYDIIDINFGCPVKKVLGRCRGGFLLSTPNEALQIVQRVYDAVGATHPVTVKMRRGFDDSAEARDSFFAILDGAFDIGVSAVTVHARTVTQRYVGPSNWRYLAEVKQRVGDRVILGSGDLFSATACIAMMRETGVDGVTIARGAIGNPWIFEECRALWRGEPLPPPPTIQAQGDAIAEHWREVAAAYGDRHGARFMRKFAIKYVEHHPLAKDVRRAFVEAMTADDLHAVLDTWYDPTKDWPPVKRRDGHGDLVAAGASL